MRFAVLGSIALDAADGPVDLRAAKQRLLLAVLLGRAGRVVAADTLVDALWDGHPPADERKRLAWHVNKLRGKLGRDRIVWHDDGYRLTVEAGELDAEVFEREFRAAASRVETDPHGASAALRTALDRWRGPAYGNLADHPTLALEARRLNELRLSALESRVDADLTANRHRDLIAELSTLVRQHPVREKYRAQLMLALYRSDRQADALEVFRDGRQLLAQQLGLEPGRELRDLERAILRSDPALSPKPRRTATPSTPTELPAAPRAFTGRRTETAWLRDRLLDDDSDSGRVCAVIGFGGVGKSALAVHVGHRLADRFPDGRLYLNLNGSTPRAAPLGCATALAQLLRSLDVKGIPGNATVDELAARFRTATAESRLLIVLDNAHDAAQVRPLLPSGQGCAVVITSRSTLSSLDGVGRLRLDALAAPDAVALFTRLVRDRDTAEPDWRDRVPVLVERCGHVPLAICVMAARLNANPHWSLTEAIRRLDSESGALGDLDDGERAVRSSFLVSYRELTRTAATAARLFRLLALHPGSDIGLAAAAALLDVSEIEVREHFAVLVSHHLWQQEASDRFRTHDLLRLFASEQLAADEPPRERERAETRMQHFYLATVRNAHRIVHLRWQKSKRLDQPPRELVHPGLSLATNEEAYGWLSTQIHNLLAVLRCADDAVVCSSVAALDNMLEHLGRARQRREFWALALAAAARSGRREFAYLAHVDAAVAQSRTDDLDGLLEHGLKARQLARECGEEAWEAVALQRIGTVLGYLGRDEESIDYIRQGLDIDLRLGNLIGVSAAYGRIGLILRRLGRYDEAIASYELDVATSTRAGHLFNQAVGQGNLAWALLAQERFAEAERAFKAALNVDREAKTTDTRLESDHLWGLGEAQYGLGEPEAARENWRRSARILHDLDLMDADELRRIETASRPPMPEIHKV